MEGLDELKSFVDLKIEEEQESVSSIYITYIQPFLTSGGNIDEFITPNEFLIQFRPGTIKIRRCILQILLLMEIFHSQNRKDPLPDNNMNEILLLLRSIAPLAPIISESMLLDIFEEIDFIHGEQYPQTIDFLMKSIGITEDDMSVDLFIDQAENPHRIHYDDGEVVQTGLEFQPNKTVLQNFPLFQTAKCQENKKVKKPKHGPEVSWKSTH